DERQPKLVRRRAFEVLVRDPQPWQQEAIRRDFASGDRDWKMTAIFSMGYVRGFDRELVEQLRTASGDLLYEAVRAAGRAEVQEAAPIIEGLAISEEADRDVRLEAIAALPAVDPDCFDLLDELAESQDDEVRAAAEGALEELQMIDEDLEDDDEEDDL
ncbi:MAG TPA: HEAT repeat domain-containing protein, partial [Thermoanaerobaculia bacterium]